MHRAQVWRHPGVVAWPWVAQCRDNLTWHPTWEDAMECAYALVRLYNPEPL